MDIKETIIFWYKQLNFPSCYDYEFYRLLNKTKIKTNVTVENYKFRSGKSRENLPLFLYFCEGLMKKYEDKGIPKNILYDTLSDIVVWTNIYSSISGKLTLGETQWLKNHFEMKLFKIGRLQFRMRTSSYDIDNKGIKKGDNVLEIHIPQGDRICYDEIISSVNDARKFFEKYFPNFNYKYMTCHSWLLDETLKHFLNEDSNIVKFQTMFDIEFKQKSDAVLRYVFSWDTKRKNLKKKECKSEFAKAIKESVLKGKVFYEALGVYKL